MPKYKFLLGEKLVYPNHGVVVVEHIGESPIMGSDRSYYHLRLLANNSRLVVPVENTDKVGLRRLIQPKEVKELLSLLEKPAIHRSEDWKGRYRENLELMNTGRLEDVGEVVKQLLFIQHGKSLSFREKKMLDRAMYLLVSEIAIVRGFPDAEAERLILRCINRSLNFSNAEAAL